MDAGIIERMRIDSVSQLKAALEAAANRTVKAPGAASAVDGRPDFGAALDRALQKVSETQQHSAQMQRAFTTGDPQVSLEQTMVAMQKSQVAFQAAVTVRNRLVAAYTEIMNMSV